MSSTKSKNLHNSQLLRDTEHLDPVFSAVLNDTEYTVCQANKPKTLAGLVHNESYDKQPRSLNVNELTVKIHTDLLSNIIQSREQNNKYQTNKLIKYASAFYILKSLTPSGIIQDYRGQLPELCAWLNCTVPTFYKLIRNCERLGYLKRYQGNIVLKSYTEFTNTFDLILTQFTKVTYNFKEQKFNHLLETAYLQLMERTRAITFENKIKALPELIRELETVITPNKNGKYQKSLEEMQIQAFKYGHKKMNEIFFLNPFTTCNSKTMREKFGFKSEQSVAYLKAKLQKKKLVTLVKIRVPSQKNSRIKKHFVEWDLKTKQTIWILPDKLEYAPILQN